MIVVMLPFNNRRNPNLLPLQTRPKFVLSVVHIHVKQLELTTLIRLITLVIRFIFIEALRVNISRCMGW